MEWISVKDRLQDFAETADDAVPVVRCKDCKYASEIMPFTCLCLLSKIRMALDGFCSIGENRVMKNYGKIMEEVKPCPFCGGKARIDQNEDGFGVTCLSCGAEIGYNVEETEDEAVRAWNTRVG